MAAEYGLQLEQVSMERKGFALKDITFSLPKGFILGLAGENGAGKTTLFRTIMNRGVNYTGEIYVDGYNLRTHREEAYAKIGFISDEQILFEEEDAMGNADLLAPFYPDFDRELYRSKLKEFEVPTGTAVKKFSRGQRIRCLLAFSMAHHSSLYLIDEATAGMDLVYRKDFFRLLKHLLDETEASVVLITHLREELEMQVDYRMILSEGKVQEFTENLQ